MNDHISSLKLKYLFFIKHVHVCIELSELYALLFYFIFH